VQLVQQLVNALALPLDEGSESDTKYYDESHRSTGAKDQDDLMP
jgi:hypothetical protein